MTSVLHRAPASRGALHVLALLAMIFLMGNIGALVDSIFHPEIPYLDEEHLLAGGMTALISGLLFLALITYTRRLAQARQVIRHLESFVSICAHCKKVRRPGMDPAQSRSWQSIESYLRESMGSEASHGLCPDCLAAHYPEYAPGLDQAAGTNPRG